MAWSLLNHMAAEQVTALLDGQKDSYPPEVERFFSRDKAEAIIHAAIWGHSARSDSTAGCYAFSNLMDALGIKNWTFDDAESDAINRMRRETAEAKRNVAPTAP